MEIRFAPENPPVIKTTCSSAGVVVVVVGAPVAVVTELVSTVTLGVKESCNE